MQEMNGPTAEGESGDGNAAKSECARPLRGPHAGYIPNVIVHTHNNRRAWFYDDLIAGKTVLLHCIGAHDVEHSAGLATLARVQALLGDKMGRSVFIYSIAAPGFETDVLRSLASRYGAGDGWMFLTADAAAVNLLQQRLFIHSGGQDCSMTLLRYGNEAVGLWGGTPITAGPELIVERLSWITPRESPEGPSRRAGPPELPA